MEKNKYYHYFVEGEDEEKIVKVLKTDMRLILPGKVQKFNVVQERLNRTRVMTLRQGTTVILVFDTDRENTAILRENIAFLEHISMVEEVICITQVGNLEEELVRSCEIQQIKELTNSRSNREFKHDLLKANNFHKNLEKHKFDIRKFWAASPSGAYKGIVNGGEKIKIYAQEQ